jgi:thioredoxin 1
MTELLYSSLEEFEKELRESPTPCLVDFYANWCPPCQAMNPVVEKIKEELEEKLHVLKVIKINTDRYPEIAQRFMVRGIPTFIMFVNGVETWRQIGADATALTRKIEETLRGLP